MAYLSTFMYAEGDSTEITPQGQKIHLINPQLIFQPMFIPSMFSFAVAFGIIEVNTREVHRLRCVFRKAEESSPLVDTGEIELPVVTEENDLPADMQGFMMNLGFHNVPFRSEGTYNTDIYLDGTLIGTHPIKVRGKESHGS